MRQHKILIRTLLIPSIFNFALAAPAAVRARPEVHLGASVIRNVPAALQKRGDPWDWGRSPDVPGPNYDPAPSPDLSDVLSQIPHADSPPPTPDHGMSQVVYVDSPSPSPDHGLPQVVYVDSPSPTPNHGLSQVVYVDSPSPTPDHGPPEIVYVDSPSPTPDHALPPSPDNTASVPSELWDNVADSLPTLPTLPPHPSQSGPSEDHPPDPSGPSVNPDTLPTTGSTDSQPTPPKSPEVDPQMHSLLNPEPFPSDFWDKVLKGKFKRLTSGSDAVNLARKDTRL